MPTPATIPTAIKEWELERFKRRLCESLLEADLSGAAIAAFRASIQGEWTRRSVCLRCCSAQEMLALRRCATLLASYAKQEGVNTLSLATANAKFQISTRMSSTSKQWRANMSPAIAIPGVQTNMVRYDETLLRVLSELLEHRDQAYGLVEVETERQVMISEASARIILGSLMDRLPEDEIRQRVADATSLKRSDYFESAEGLREFNREIRQRLEPNNPDSKIILRPRLYGRDGTLYQYVHEYRAIRDDLGQIYQLGRSIDVTPVAA